MAQNDAPESIQQVKKELTELRKTIRYHNNRYYNEDNPEISDYEYDQLIPESPPSPPDTWTPWQEPVPESWIPGRPRPDGGSSKSTRSPVAEAPIIASGSTTGF